MLGWTPEVVMDGSLMKSVGWLQPQRRFWARCIGLLTGSRSAA